MKPKAAYLAAKLRGRVKRAEAEQEMRRMEEELKQKLLQSSSLG